MSEEKYIALTFEDGPNDTTTAEVLIKLLKYQVVASFFLVGDQITPDSLPIIRDAYEMGCEIGNHSKTHTDMTTLTKEQMLEEISYTSNRIAQITGEAPRFFLPPYMQINEMMRKTISLPIIDSCECEELKEEQSAKESAERILKQITPGGIIRMHDTKGNRKTVEALDLLIPTLKSQGYGFITVSDLFHIYNKKIEDGCIYHIKTGN